MGGVCSSVYCFNNCFVLCRSPSSLWYETALLCLCLVWEVFPHYGSYPYGRGSPGPGGDCTPPFALTGRFSPLNAFIQLCPAPLLHARQAPVCAPPAGTSVGDVKVMDAPEGITLHQAPALARRRPRTSGGVFVTAASRPRTWVTREKVGVSVPRWLLPCPWSAGPQTSPSDGCPVV